MTEQAGAGGADAEAGAGGAAIGGTAGSSAGGNAGSSAGGAAGAGLALTLPTPSPCVFESEDGGLQRCTNGLLHRAAAASCPSLLPLPDPVPISDQFPEDAGYPFECRRDTDCIEHAYGHCSTESSFLPRCEYGCMVDSDCPQNQLCSCQSYGGRCIPGNCRTDRDCGQGLCGSNTICSATLFACQTALDQCAGDSDCPTGQLCTVEPSDITNPNSFLRRACRDRPICAAALKREDEPPETQRTQSSEGGRDHFRDTH